MVSKKKYTKAYSKGRYYPVTFQQRIYRSERDSQENWRKSPEDSKQSLCALLRAQEGAKVKRSYLHAMLSPWHLKRRDE